MNLESRVERLERQNRWLKAGGAVALSAVLIVFLMGQAASVPDEIKAQRFTAVDEKGRTRAVLIGTLTGSFLSLQDDKGNERVSLSVSDGVGPHLIFNGEDKTMSPRIELVSSPFMSSLHLRKGRMDAFLALDPSAGVNFSLSHKILTGSATWLAADSRGTSLRLTDDKGKIRVSIGVTESGPGLSLFDNKRMERARLGVSQQVNTHTGVEYMRPENSLVLYNAEREVVWKAP